MMQQQQQPTRAELREQIREQVRKSVEDARAEVEAAISTPTPPGRPQLPPLPPMEPLPPVAVEPLETYTIDPRGMERLDDIPPRAQELGMMFLFTMAVMVIGFPIARAIGRVIDRRWAAPALPAANMQPQLLRIEQAVEAMSIEIERISENQRYLTRLQAGREEEGVLVPRRARD